jgi:hypothetical protein
MSRPSLPFSTSLRLAFSEELIDELKILLEFGCVVGYPPVEGRIRTHPTVEMSPANSTSLFFFY